MRKIVFISVSVVLNTFLAADTISSSIAACDAGDAKACYDAGNTYSAEAYKEKNYNRVAAASKVASFYKKSCDLGYAEGCTGYGINFAADKNSDPQENAGYYLQKGCEGGDTVGCNLLNFSHFNQ